MIKVKKGGFSLLIFLVVTIGAYQLWDDPLNRVYSTSTVISPSDGSSPMAYTVSSWAEYSDDEPPRPTGLCKITFVAWDTLNANRRPQAIPTSVSTLDEINVGSGNVYDMEASIAVSGHPGPADTIHICYKWRESGVDRIFYKKNTNWINPSRIRSGIAPTWSERTPISTPKLPITQPASQPSIEFYSNRVVVVWRGPNASGEDIGEIYRSWRSIGRSDWSSPANVSKSLNQESRHPEGSQGELAVVFQEQLPSTNWEIYLNLATSYEILNISNTSTPSRYPHTATNGNITHEVWTEELATNNYRVYYRRYEYIPAGGPPSAGETRLADLQMLSNPKAKYVKFRLPNASFQMEIYDNLDKLIYRTFAKEEGIWNYEKVSSGVYFYLVKAEETSRSGKIMILIKKERRAAIFRPPSLIKRYYE